MVISRVLAALVLVQPPALMDVRVLGRDPITLDNTLEIFRGTCNGRDASAIIMKARHGHPGILMLQYERLAREVPSSFLNGRLFASTHYAAGLRCDGQSLIFAARATSMGSDGTIRIQAQSAMMDLQTGNLSVSEIRNLDKAEIRLELR